MIKSSITDQQFHAEPTTDAIPAPIKRLIVTGASGFIGQQIVPALHEAGMELLLVGRDKEKLKKIFPSLTSITYDEISGLEKKFDALLHLAVLNNNTSFSENDYYKANVELLKNVISASIQSNISHIINITTLHTLNGSTSAYARSKQDALNITRNTKGIIVQNLFLPAVYGEKYAGKLNILNYTPSIMRPLLFTLLSSTSPTLNVNLLVSLLKEKKLNTNEEQDIFISDNKDDNIVYKTTKKIIDLTFAISIIAILWWALLIVWIAIKMESDGPGIFKQERVGRYGKIFVCYKFRTMQKGTRQVGTHELSNDAITRVGAILRKTKLDELPQVFNIIKGELSLVGPRPCLPNQKLLIEERYKRGVLNVIPGITGLAQINDIDMSNEHRLAYWDALYIAQRSIFTDIKIIIATFLGKGQGDRVK